MASVKGPSGPQDTESPAPSDRDPVDSPPPIRSVPTMRDIAAAAGVSQSTVSRVLNDAPTTGCRSPRRPGSA